MNNKILILTLILLCKFNLNAQIQHSSVRPFDDFLKSNIVKVIVIGYSGDITVTRDTLIYELKDTVLQSTAYIINSSHRPFSCHISSNVIKQTLNNINQQIEKEPSLYDFNITDNDKNNYLDYVENHTDDAGTSSPLPLFYENILNNIDTINPATITKMLDKGFDDEGSVESGFKVLFINDKNDILSFSTTYSFFPPIWLCPIKCKYRNEEFNCSNVALGKLLASSIPTDFIGYEAFNNKILLLRIAQYLYSKKH